MLVRLYHPQHLLDNGNVVLKHLKMPFSAPPWLRWHPTPLVSHPLQVVHFRLLPVTHIKQCPLGLCLRPVVSYLPLSLQVFSASPLASGAIRIAMIPKFTPHVLTSLLSPASPIGYLNLAQTHRPKAGTSPAPRKTCASSRECPLPCESGPSHFRLHRLACLHIQ